MDSSICSVFALWRYARQRNVIPHLSSATEHHRAPFWNFHLARV